MNLPSRRWWLAVLLPTPPAAAQIFSAGKRVDDLVTRIAKVEERLQGYGERLAAVESRTAGKVCE